MTPSDLALSDCTTFTKKDHLDMEPEILNNILKYAWPRCKHMYEEPIFGLKDITQLKEGYNIETMSSKKYHYQ